MTQPNPLLDFTALPKFALIIPAHVEPALKHLLARNRRQIKALIDTIETPDWDNFMAPLEQLDDALERMWAMVSHLNSVRDSQQLRDAYQACLPRLSDYATEMGQHKSLFANIKSIQGSAQYQHLEQPKKQVIANALRDFRLSGIALGAQEQQRYRQICSELANLCNRFSQNVLDATDAWHLDIVSKDIVGKDIATEQALAGIPQNALQQAMQTATQAGVDGWRFSLHAPCYNAVMTYADNQALRQTMYRAYVTRASNADGWDNSELMQQILRLRQHQASLLGYQHYGALSVATKMAESTEQVIEFLEQLVDKSRSQGLAEVAELKRFAADQLGLAPLAPWDYGYASEKLRQHRYQFSQEQLRPYFPLPKVLQGMFEIVGRLFGIVVVAAPTPEVWHPEVQFFNITDQHGVLRAQFYIDLYARKHKRGGAWMADCIGRRLTGAGMQLPVALLNCNFSAPVGDQPALLTHDEVITLFHEFGHGLHHMLTRIEVSAVAGINGVPWDAVELPSQFLENWCWQPAALALISGHVETEDPLPLTLLQKMRQARNFQSAMQMCRQLELSLFDMRIHSDYKPEPGCSVRSILHQVRQQVAVLETPDFNRFENSFEHIFAGEYAAGYYSYKWAEVLSADAFSLFEERGIFDAEVGQLFLQNILEAGGSEPPMVLFEAFRGRKPNVEALLRYSGLSSSTVAA